MFKDQQTAAFEEIIVDQTPMIDVRSPVEFKAGAIPSAVNIPLLDDQERHTVLLERERVESYAVDEELIFLGLFRDPAGAGSPRLYLPVRKPAPSGLYEMTPTA